MCTQEQLEQVYKEIVQHYREIYGEDIESIVLYGSYARGDYDSESDVDIVAIVHGEREKLQQKLKCIWDYSVDIGVEYDIVISPTVIPYNEFEQYKRILPYYMNIVREGKQIG